MKPSLQDTREPIDAPKVLDAFRRIYRCKDADIAAALQIDEPTLRGYATGDRVPTDRVRKSIADLQELAFFLEEIFSDGADAARWLNKTAPVLKGRRPIDLIRTGKLDKVISVLATFHAGAFL